MTKKLLLGSMVAAALIFTGCGDDDDTTPPSGGNTDTVKPVVKTTATAAVDSAVVLATDNVGVTEITLSGDDAAGFTVSGTTVTTPATAGNYMVTVLAKDAAGNEETGDVNVTVTGGAQPPSNTISSSGLIWTVINTVDDDASADDGRVDRDVALSKCPAGMTFPTVQQLEDANLTDLLAKQNITTIIPIWVNDNATTGYALDGAASPVDGYTFTPDAGDTEYYTCVKAVAN